MNMLFGAIGNTGVPADEKVIRATAVPVDITEPPAEMSHAPDVNEMDTDPNPRLGMVNRTLASDWHEPEQYPPFWAGNVDAVTEGIRIINSQVSSSGTAAQRETAGQFGHGTAGYAEGIEPVFGLTEQGRMGNNYLAVGKPDIQETAGNYMTVPPGYDHEGVALSGATAKTSARDANAASIYNTWYGANR